MIDYSDLYVKPPWFFNKNADQEIMKQVLRGPV
jgi:hypothetical protein